VFVAQRMVDPDGAAVSTPMGIEDVLAVQLGGAVVLDAREPLDFASGHLAGSLNVPAGGRLAEITGMVVGPEEPLVVVAAQDRERDIVLRLAEFNHVLGYLRDPEGAFHAVRDRLGRASRLTAPELAAAMERPDRPVVIDVRDADELAGGAIFRARHLPLTELARRTVEVPPGRPLVVYCGRGHRSSVAASLLRREGWRDVSDLLGGYAAWAALVPAPAG
jgi:hydroxyacylglutathione hydrolase